MPKISYNDAGEPFIADDGTYDVPRLPIADQGTDWSNLITGADPDKPTLFPGIRSGLSQAGKLLTGEAKLASPSEIGQHIYGQNRLKTWPEQMLTNAVAGEPASWSVNPQTGEIHTSPETIERGLDIAGMAGGGFAAKPNAVVIAARSSELAPLASLAKEHFGLTRNPKEAGYILPDGSMLDLSGRHQDLHTYERIGDANVPKAGERDYFKNQRNTDHREDLAYIYDRAGITSRPSDNSRLMRNFIQQTDAIRNYPGQGFEVSFLPTDNQLKTIVAGHNSHFRGDPLNVDIVNPSSGDSISSKTFDRPNVEQVRQFINTVFKSDTAKPGAAVAANAPRFYSALENAVKDSRTKTASAEQWLGELRNRPGVKQEELDWVLHDLPEGAITKDKLSKIVDANKVELKEINKGYDPEATAKGKALAESHGNNWDSLSQVDQRRYIQTASGAKLTEDIGGPKHSQWQLPGGENYREMIMTLPENAELKAKDAALNARQKELMSDGPNGYVKNIDEITRISEERNAINQKLTPFRHDHWPGIINPVAHIRMNERNIPGVGKSLHIEEGQSDLHQAGRHQGYVGEREKLEPQFNAIEKKIVDSGDEQVMSHPELKDALKMAVERKIITADEARTYQRYSDINAQQQAGNRPVMDAPFKKDATVDLVLKRMIRQAAEEGKDSISWTPGQAQADRYDLSKHIDEIGYNPQIKHLFANGPKGSVLDKLNVEPKDLPEHIGKEAADKLLNNPTRKANLVGGDYNKLEGLDLKVGGEFHKRLYDEVWVNKANAIAKKFGGKVEEGNLPFDTKKLKRDDVAPDETAQATHKEEWDKLVAEIQKRRENAADYDRKMSNEEWEQNNKDLRELNQKLDALHEKGVDETIERMKKNTKGEPVHVLRITPQLRDAALNKGFALFTDSGRVGAPLTALTRVNHDPFKLAELEKQHGVSLTPVEHNPFTTDAYHGTRNFKGDQLRTKGSYDIHRNTHTGENTYSVWDASNSRTVSPELKSEAEAKAWIDKRVGSEFFSTPNANLADDYALGSQIMPLKINTKDYHTYDAKGASWKSANAHAIFEAEQLGKKGVTIKNVIDNNGVDRGPQTVHITLDPSTVRSRFAKFDPAKFGESGLLKSAGLPLPMQEHLYNLQNYISTIEDAPTDQQQKLLQKYMTHWPDEKPASVGISGKTAALGAAKAAEWLAFLGSRNYPKINGPMTAAWVAQWPVMGHILKNDVKKQLKAGVKPEDIEFKPGSVGDLFGVVSSLRAKFGDKADSLQPVEGDPFERK